MRKACSQTNLAKPDPHQSLFPVPCSLFPVPCSLFPALLSSKYMKTDIIGLPQVGKTSLFKILTKAKLEDRGYSNPREAHIGVARVPDDRLDKLSALYSPKKTTFATVEYVDVAAIGQEALKETALLTSLRHGDALIHVLRAFE